MDISQWLRETELPPQPERFAEKDKRPTLVPPEEDNAHRPAKRRRKHGRYRSLDSSILQAAFPIHESGAETDNVARRSSSGDGTSHTQSTTSKELSSQHSEAETASDKYERKPRRKTRADRYQLKPAKEKKSKESKGRTGRHAHEERKSKKRKRKRTARDNPASGWVMGFHAKNVAKDRLTVRTSPCPKLIATHAALSYIVERAIELWALQEGPCIIACKRTRLCVTMLLTVSELRQWLDIR